MRVLGRSSNESDRAPVSLYLDISALTPSRVYTIYHLFSLLATPKGHRVAKRGWGRQVWGWFWTSILEKYYYGWIWLLMLWKFI